jgi:hypothetical protein
MLSNLSMENATVATRTPAPARIDIGISEKDREKIADGLSRLLADTSRSTSRPTTSTGT